MYSGRIFFGVCLFLASGHVKGIDLAGLEEATDDLIAIVHSEKFHNLFEKGKVKIDGQRLLDHIKEHTKIPGSDLDKVFAAMLGKKSADDLVYAQYGWEQATSAINGLIKLSENVSINTSRRPGSTYRVEDERITAAKRDRKLKEERKDEL